jgi:hypothetical protein
MKRSAGNITFGNLIFVLVVLFVGFVVVKFILVEVQSKQITGEITNVIGPDRRSSDFSQEKVVGMINNVLRDNHIDPTQASIDVQFIHNQITFHVEFEKKIDYLIFKQVKKIVIEDSMARYGI